MLKSRSFLAILALINVAACATGPTNQSYWVNPHINQSMLEQRFTIDKAECHALAYRYIPEPSAAQPGPSGTFHMTTPSGPVDGSYESKQHAPRRNTMNNFYRERDRADYARACMAERGWQREEKVVQPALRQQRETSNDAVSGMECNSDADCGPGRSCRGFAWVGGRCVDR